MRYILLLSLCLSTFFLAAQNVLPIGQWRAHQPKRVGQWVTQSEQHLYFSTRSSIMIMDKQELSSEFISTVDGLSGVDFRIIQFHEPTGKLIIIYEDGVIDIYSEENILTINSIKNFANVAGVKSINDLVALDANTFLLAGSYGVSILQLDNGSLPLTTFMGNANVEAVSSFDNYYYAGTSEGIYRTLVSSNTIEDFGTWEFLGANVGLPDDYSANAMRVFNGYLYFGANEDIYRFDGNNIEIVSDQSDNLDMLYMSTEGGDLLVGYRCTGGGCGQGEILLLDEAGGVQALHKGCLGDANNALQDQFGRIWFGDNWLGFRRLENKDATFCTTFELNSPFSPSVWDLDIVDDDVWFAAGSYTPNRTPQFLDHGLASLVDGSWRLYNRNTEEAFRGFDPDPNVRDDDVFTLVDVEVNEVTGKIYGASYNTGLIEIDGENISLFTDANSPMSVTLGDEARTRVSGLKSDEEGNLWVSNYRPVEGESLHRRAPDGTWQSFRNPAGQGDLFQIDIDENGYKWVIVGNGTAGVIVFDEGDIDNLNDDRARVFTTNNSNMPTNETNCLAVDKDGDVWVGTNEGIIIFECGASAFEDNCIGSLRIVELDGFNEFLFKTQTVQALAVDGANRKWIGTTNGIYLISEDGKDQLFHFTEENSPLIDNSVRTIAINENTGEVFIGTDKGIVSYQSDAVAGRRFNSPSPQVFPNPVRPEYNGPITVRGLATNANVKITDVNGKLVFETEALGGQAIWDGRDYNGRRVQTGVYLVMSTTNPREVGLGSPDAVVAKVVFIN